MEKKDNKKTGTSQLPERISRWWDRCLQRFRRDGKGDAETPDGKERASAGGSAGKRKLTRKKLTIGVVCAFLAIVVLVTVVVSCFPIYQIHSSSMSPRFTAGDTVVCMRGNNYEVGDVVAVEYQDRILIKRIVAQGGDTVRLNEKGELFVNDVPVTETYAINTESDRSYFASVPPDAWYILSDNRKLLGDSRVEEIGTVSDEDIVGKILFTI